jgi:hypothetical protein
MRSAIVAAILSLAAFTAVGFATPVAAGSVYQWCPVGRLGWGEAGAPSCGFSSYEQCTAVSAGACTQNPFYTGPSSADSRDARQRRR